MENNNKQCFHNMNNSQRLFKHGWKLVDDDRTKSLQDLWCWWKHDFEVRPKDLEKFMKCSGGVYRGGWLLKNCRTGETWECHNVKSVISAVEDKSFGK